MAQLADHSATSLATIIINGTERPYQDIVPMTGKIGMFHESCAIACPRCHGCLRAVTFSRRKEMGVQSINLLNPDLCDTEGDTARCYLQIRTEWEATKLRLYCKTDLGGDVKLYEGYYRKIFNHFKMQKGWLNNRLEWVYNQRDIDFVRDATAGYGLPIETFFQEMHEVIADWGVGIEIATPARKDKHIYGTRSLRVRPPELT